MWVHKDYRLFERVGAAIISGLVILYAYFSYHDDLGYYKNERISIWSAMDFGGYSLSRLILIYYFFKIFDKYPWRWPQYFDDDCHYKSKMNSTSLRLIVGLTVYIWIRKGF